MSADYLPVPLRTSQGLPAGRLGLDHFSRRCGLHPELVRRFGLAEGKHREWPEKRNPVTPV